MPAYLMVSLDVSDAAAYEEYKAKAPALIKKHGGKYIVRGGNFTVLEGSWKPTRVVVLEFPNAAAGHAFYEDPEYQPLKSLRQRVAKTDLVLVEGLDVPI